MTPTPTIESLQQENARLKAALAVAYQQPDARAAYHAGYRVAIDLLLKFAPETEPVEAVRA